MKKRTLLLAAVLSLVALLPLQAQTRAKLTIESNEVGASVYVNGRLSGYTNPTFTQVLPVGTYALKLVKKGYVTWEQRVSLSSKGLFVKAPLYPEDGSPSAGRKIDDPSSGKKLEDPSAGRQLGAPNTLGKPLPQKMYKFTIHSNVEKAEVSLNGKFVGNAPVSVEIRGGTYQLSVSYPGYHTLETPIRIDESGYYKAELVADNIVLVVYSSVNGADVYLDDKKIGTTPFKGEIPKGYYMLSVRAPGYETYESKLYAQDSQEVKANLKPNMGSVNVIVPTMFIDQGNSRDRIQLYIDDVLQSGLSVQVAPGVHTITLRSGALRFSNTVTIEAGRTISLELNAGLLIR